MSLTLAVLPNAGLGNKLFVWAKAAVFAHRNALPLAVLGWDWPRLGALLRVGVDGRYYASSFAPRYRELASATARLCLATQRITEPSLHAPLSLANAAYIFKQMPHWSDYFGDFREDCATVRTLLYAELRRDLRAAIEARPPPVVAVHVRRGDFRELAAGEDFAKVGNVRTRLDYFEYLVREMRNGRGGALPVTVFSDGADADLAPLLSLPNVTRSRSASDVEDLLHMSRARLIVASAGSTFSEWAGFLADAPLIMHPDHIHKPVRPDHVNQRYHEGSAIGQFAQWPGLLRRNIDELAAVVT